jgi:hypothetical protein
MNTDENFLILTSLFNVAKFYFSKVNITQKE